MLRSRRRRHGVPVRLVRENRTGAPGYDVRCPSSLSEEIRKAFLSAGARPASDAELESLRIEAGIPRWGFELTEAVLPDEAGLRERGFISDSKGCYIGQETVARIKTYGHVNRNLVRLLLEGEAPGSRQRDLLRRREGGRRDERRARGGLRPGDRPRVRQARAGRSRHAASGPHERRRPPRDGLGAARRLSSVAPARLRGRRPPPR